MASADTPEKDAPQAPPTSPVLKAVVIGLGVAILVMTALLILGLSLGWNNKSKPATDTAAPAVPVPGEGAQSVLEIETAKDSRLYTLAGDGSRIALHIAAPTGDEIIVIDTAANRVISRIRLKPAP